MSDKLKIQLLADALSPFANPLISEALQEAQAAYNAAATVPELTKQIEVHKTRLERAMDREGKLVAKLAEVEKESEALRVTIADLKRAAEAHRAEVEAMSAHPAVVAAKVAELSARRAALDEQIKALAPEPDPPPVAEVDETDEPKDAEPTTGE